MENGENTVSRFEKERLEICAIFCNDGVEEMMRNYKMICTVVPCNQVVTVT